MVKLQISDEKSIDGSSALNGFLITSPLYTMLRRLEARRAVAKPPGSQQGGHGTWGRRGSSLLYFSFFFSMVSSLRSRKVRATAFMV
jgi:hypothetical protein